MTRSIVFDSWPLMAYVTGEPAAQRVIRILADCHENGVSMSVSVINAGEIWYSIAGRVSPQVANREIGLFRELGIRFVPVDWPLAQIAAQFKTGGGISYADCFAAALAKQTDATLITGDREFKKVESEIDIEWL